MRLGDLDSGERLLSADEAGELVGLSAQTWRTYVARRIAPAATLRAGPAPLWRESVVVAWLAARPGQGARTDLDPSQGGDRSP